MTEVLTANTELTVYNVLLDDIYSDSSFNIRGEIRMSDIIELAKNIDSHTLLQPISVQPYDKHPPQTKRIILGHRRFAAFEYLKRKTIPAIIREGLTDVQAMALNFNENVNRKDLNILEEAYGVQRFLDAGEDVESIAKIVNKGKKWVVIRRDLLTYPKPIQEDAATGWLTQAQIADLVTVHGDTEKMAIVKAIKEAKGRNERRLPTIKTKKSNPTARKRRTPEDIMDMIEHVLDETHVVSPFTRAWAWANGEISDLDLYREMQAYFDAHDILYSPPLEVLDYMKIVSMP